MLNSAGGEDNVMTTVAGRIVLLVGSGVFVVKQGWRWRWRNGLVYCSKEDSVAGRVMGLCTEAGGT